MASTTMTRIRIAEAMAILSWRSRRHVSCHWLSPAIACVGTALAACAWNCRSVTVIEAPDWSRLRPWAQCCRAHAGMLPTGRGISAGDLLHSYNSGGQSPPAASGGGRAGGQALVVAQERCPEFSPPHWKHPGRGEATLGPYPDDGPAAR